MKNETLIISGVLFNFIFESSQGQWCLTRKQSSNWSTSFQSIFNSHTPGPGINKSQCLDYCGQYSFSTRPSRSDFPLIRLGLRVSSLIFDFGNSIHRLYLGMNSETDQEIFWYPKYWVKIDINCFPFMPMFHLILKQWLLDSKIFFHIITYWSQVKWIKLYQWFDFSKKSNVRVATKKLFWFESCSK